MEDNRHKFQCSFPGCNRSYLRSEHLNRHALIHKKGAFVCYLCQRRFTRNDLLNAHLRRHEKRGHSQESAKDTSAEPTLPPPAPAEPLSRPAPDARSPPAKDWNVLDARFDQPVIPNPAQSIAEGPPPIPSFHSPVALPPPRAGSSHGVYQHASPNDAVSQNSASSSGTLPSHIPQPPYIPAPEVEDDYTWLFRGASLFDLPPDDYLNLHFGGNIGTSPPGLYSNPGEQSVSPRVGTGISIAEHERLMAECPNLVATPLKDISQVDQVLYLALDYCDLYMPLFHRPTFESSAYPPTLLLALCALGAFVNNTPSFYETGKLLQKHLWGLTVEKALLSPRVDMWFLQALVIIEHICTYTMNRREHEMAEIVHSMIVTLARRNNLMTENHRTEGGHRLSLDVKWREWAQRESVIRIAHTIFVNDVQYMVYFSHHASLSVGMMKLPLPSHPSLWEAPSASDWEAQMRQVKRPGRSRFYSLQSSVESLMSIRDPELKREFFQRHSLSNQLSLHLLIHGIASAIGDAKYRSIVSSSTPAIHNLRMADFDEALSHWRVCFERLSESERASKQSWNALVMYYFSAILLRNNLPEIQMAAGSAFSSGRAVTPQGAQAAYTRLVSSDAVSHDSYLHGLEVVSLCLHDFDSQNPSSGDPFLTPSPRPLWQTYGAFLGILVIWAHTLGLEKLGNMKVNSITSLRPLPPAFVSSTAAATLANMYDRELGRSKFDMREVQKIKDELRRLISTVCDRLGERTWEISQEACKILSSLGEREEPRAHSYKANSLSMIMSGHSVDQRPSYGRV
ncbi:hypothetical protein AJ79_05357 [Helicocarpus griseus UAMH5409]|uniref:C2H2-type domain-containing protein n=1 Tax=Helicocarpus griseus UAMH5409 TaxID=1447875 RepID=A0A2B7XPB7_9EURO|nr:hypothetical protein AJ79_05357 [Helicocarpus griseus UAMH5409]